MTPSLARTRHPIALGILLLALACVLAGCETDGTPSPGADKPPEPPMTHQRAAGECWMGTEKSSAGMTLDQRADVVTKCIERKMKGTAGNAAPAAAGAAADAKKKKPAADTQKKKPAAAGADGQDKKPPDAAGGEPDKKP
jgi:hypothetical protein